jgi:hypothetical protein
MRSVLGFCLASGLFLTGSIAHSQSLGDLAKQEKLRREGIQNDKVITAADAARFKSEPAAAPSIPTPSPDKTAESKSEEEAIATNPPSKADPNEPADFQGKTESYWRKTMAEARKSVKDLENEANVQTLKLNDLQNKLNGAGIDGTSAAFKMENVQREMQKGYYEQDLKKEQLAKAKAVLQDLENEARKNGALPGWIENPER